MSKPWMPLHIGDYRKDTGHLSTAQHGAYLLLIMHYWTTGGLPDDDGKLARIVGMTAAEWRRSRPTLEAFFAAGWRHKRIEAELAKTLAISEQRSASGQAGARRKWRDEHQARDAQWTRSGRLSEARQKGRHTEDEWAAMVKYCGDKCVKCKAQDETVKDHIQPIYQGGSDAIENLQPLCRRCNSSKGADTTDYRPGGWQASIDRLANASQNAKQTPAQPQPQPQPQPQEQKKEPEADASAADVRTRLFRGGLESLQKMTGRTPDSCRSLIGRWLSMANDEAVHVLGLIEDAERNTIADPSGWIFKQLQLRKKPENAHEPGNKWIEANQRIRARIAERTASDEPGAGKVSKLCA